MSGHPSFSASANRSCHRSGLIREPTSVELLALQLMYSERENSLRQPRPQPSLRKFSWEG